MNQSESRGRRLAKCSLGLGSAAVLAPLLGGLGTRLGLWNYGIGLLLTPLGLLLGLVGLVLGLIALLRQRKAGARLTLSASGSGLSLLISLYLGVAVLSAFTVPPIHNVSTDIADPPQFTVAESLRGEGDNPLFYDSAVLGPIQREGYPEIQPVVMDLTRDQAYELVTGVLTDMGLELVREDPEQAEIEAVATSFWFGFKDDLVVRLREVDEGTRMDIRSVSRVGVVDLGANAERILEVISRVQECVALQMRGMRLTSRAPSPQGRRMRRPYKCAE